MDRRYSRRSLDVRVFEGLNAGGLAQIMGGGWGMVGWLGARAGYVVGGPERLDPVYFVYPFVGIGAAAGGHTDGYTDGEEVSSPASFLSGIRFGVGNIIVFAVDANMFVLQVEDVYSANLRPPPPPSGSRARVEFVVSAFLGLEF